MENKTTCFRYWPKNKPIPDDWIKVGRMEQSHHGEWSVIIMKVREDDLQNK